MLTNFRVDDRVEDKETHKRGRVIFVYSELGLKARLSRSYSTATTKRLLFRLTAFAKSQPGNHECCSCELPRGDYLSRNTTAAELRRTPAGGLN